jgi:hypothetical protein
MFRGGPIWAKQGITLGVPLALYRRHRSECKGQHPHNLRTSEYDERKKGWKRCECPIFVSGTTFGLSQQQAKSPILRRVDQNFRERHFSYRPCGTE